MVLKICNQPYAENSDYEPYFSKYGFPLSDFQKYAIEAIVEKHHVLVTAHTGSGKTLPAEFAIEHLVSQGKKVVYTSPIKALSNQKFSEFTRKYPNISFGLLTGDIKTNPEADVLIMTTEILMNYLFIQTTCDPSKKDNTQLHFQIDLENELGAVVFDEVHYINDEHRGQTWEKTILMLPSHVQMVMLSATIDAPQRFAKWVMRGNDNKDVYLASTNKRVVPLTHYGFWTYNEGDLKKITEKTIVKDIKDHSNKLICLQNDKGMFQEQGYKDLKRMAKLCTDKKMSIKRKQVLNSTCKFLRNNNMLPAICFIFSRKMVEFCASDITVPLLDDETRESYNIAKECEQIVRKLPNYKEYMELPEYRNLVSLLEKGIGIHHSGMVPILREIVEIMISKKYIYLLFATESFAIGLDCPIKTAVFSSLTKYDGNHERLLMGHEYTQMAGRAGRRGIDTIGNVVHLNNLFAMPMQNEYSTILKGKPQSLVSKFKISYELILNLLKNGKNKKNDFCDFVENSMVQTELLDSIENQKKIVEEYTENEKRLKEELKLVEHSEVLNEYKALVESLETNLSNNKRKNCENKIESLKKTVPEVSEYVKQKEEYDEWVNQLQKETYRIENLQYYVEDGISDVCHLLEEERFVCYDEDEKHYELTELGLIASNLAEAHPILLTHVLRKYQMFRSFDVDQIIGLLAVFCDVNIDKNVKRNFPFSKDEYLKEVLYGLDDFSKTFQDLEYKNNIESEYDYVNMFQYDMPDLAMEWVHCENEGQCKLFLEKIKSEYGLSVGDFTKAMIKVTTIVREISAIAETQQNVECLYKLNQIDNLLLKYITTCQSLYV